MYKHGVARPAHRDLKTLLDEMGAPIFLDISVLRKCPKVKWRIPFFGVQTPRGKASARKMKTPKGQWTLGPGRALSTSGCHQIGTRRIYLKIVSMAKMQALRWQTFAPSGTFSTNLVGDPRTDAPQLISNLVFLVIKQERLVDSGFVTLAA